MSLRQRLGAFHQRVLHPQRVGRLVEAIAPLLGPEEFTLLDVGCGDGQLAHDLAARHGALTATGIDVLVRPSVVIPVTQYDGRTIPLDDDSVDVTMLIDVLHHADDIGAVLAECARVTRRVVIVKDHIARNRLDNSTLKLMDWVGNRHTGVALPYRYPSESEWHQHFADAGLNEMSWSDQVPVYSAPITWVAGRRLHLLCALEPTG